MNRKNYSYYDNYNDDYNDRDRYDDGYDDGSYRNDRRRGGNGGRYGRDDYDNDRRGRGNYNNDRRGRGNYDDGYDDGYDNRYDDGYDDDYNRNGYNRNSYNRNNYNDGGRNGNNRNRNNGGGHLPRSPRNYVLIAAAVLLSIFLIYFMSGMLNGTSPEEVTYNEFWEMLMDDQIASVEIDSTQITFTTKPEEGSYAGVTYYTGYLSDEELIPVLKEKGIEYDRIIEDSGYGIFEMLLIYILPIVLIWVIFAFLMRRMSGGSGGGGIMGVGKSNAKVYAQKSTGVTFQDVAGQDEAKESLTEIVDFLHNPDKYSRIGAKLPKGALLVGPPGTGKTLLAKAVAGEANVPFFSLSGSDFVEMFVGVGASRVRDLFKQAQENAPCIIFIDEIDAIGKSRDGRYSGNDEREQTLNALLAEMDGFDSSKGVLILAATNRPEILDPALLRPGRFDRRIIVDKPDLKGRIQTLEVHAKDVHLDESVDFEAIALATSGAVGSDLANMINEAAINAVKHGRSLVSQDDLLEAVEVVLVGKEKKDRIMSPEERRIVSYHEVGHALVSALQKHSEPVQKITIVPRTMGALGFTMQTPEEEKYLNSKEELWDMIVGLLGGRAAEEIVFHSVTTGASNDFEQATKIARAMITQYGMNDQFGMMNLESVEDPYLGGHTVLNCSDETAAEVDKEVMQMLKDAYEEAKSLLEGQRAALDEIAAFLIEKETITGKEFMEILNQVQERERIKAEIAANDLLRRETDEDDQGSVEENTDSSESENPEEDPST